MFGSQATFVYRSFAQEYTFRKLVEKQKLHHGDGVNSFRTRGYRSKNMDRNESAFSNLHILVAPANTSFWRGVRFGYIAQSACV